MSIFKPGRGIEPRHFKIKVITEGGREIYWHKQGCVHIVEEDVAEIFLAKFNPELFEILPDGSMTAPRPGESLVIKKLIKERA
ncbi:MAG: hypothetical protein MK538_13175 [Planctomycetes bacterium]|nr:hypothetical protein [Planctomycetota bacterium]|tara:strand:- start:290 stop:538 length:249 start_codon:yes stop_codon:yes gene_type:complete